MYPGCCVHYILYMDNVRTIFTLHFLITRPYLSAFMLFYTDVAVFGISSELSRLFPQAICAHHSRLRANHRLNMVLDLQSLFELLRTAVLIG
jgi:hypothetical protein